MYRVLIFLNIASIYVAIEFMTWYNMVECDWREMNEQIAFI